MTPTLAANRKKDIERTLEDDRRAIEQARAKRATQRQAAVQAKQTFREARRALRRAAG